MTLCHAWNEMQAMALALDWLLLGDIPIFSRRVPRSAGPWRPGSTEYFAGPWPVYEARPVNADALFAAAGCPQATALIVCTRCGRHAGSRAPAGRSAPAARRSSSASGAR
jgi:hypothetical protein